jgi:hypothetical protein
VDSGTSQRYDILRLRPGAVWRIERIEVDKLTADLQGDPRWPAAALGRYPGLSGFLGLLRSYEDEFIAIPSAGTINKKLARLGEYYPLRFDFQGAAGCARTLINVRCYVDQFIDFQRIPMQRPTTRPGIHDWSYHFLSMLFPDQLRNLRLNLALIRAASLSYLGAADDQWVYYGHTSDRAGRLVGVPRAEGIGARVAVYRRMGIAIDTMTGRLIQLLNAESAGMLDRCPSALELASLFLSPPSPESMRRILPYAAPARFPDTSRFRCDGARSGSRDVIQAMHERLHGLDLLCERTPRLRVASPPPDLFAEAFKHCRSLMCG